MRAHQDIRRRLLDGTALLTSPALFGLGLGLGLGLATPAHANPRGGAVAAGAVTIQQSGNTLTVTQGTNRAIVNWNAFSIGAGELTRFVQPGSGAAILNRVVTGAPSRLLGQLQGNGSVYLINPNGILVGPGAHVDVGAFVASTRNVTDPAFLKGGDLPFFGTSSAGVVNFGTIDARTGGVALLGQNVFNAGAVNAPYGTVSFAAGTDLLLKASGPDAVLVRAGSGDGTATGVANQGTITAAAAALKAAGGNVYALAVNNSGAIQATGLSRAGGRIMLTSDGGAIENSGSLSARAADGNGGTVVMDAGAGRASLAGGSIDVAGRGAGTVGGSATVTGRQVALDGAASIVADGDAGGGTIAIGGGRHGADAAIANAQQVYVGADVRLSANAGRRGNGGAITVWSDQATHFAGQASARGGAGGGDGGSAEVSSKGTLGYSGTVDLRAPRGATGTLLLDPSNLTIATGLSSGGVTNAAGFFSDTSNTGNQVVDANTIVTQLGLSAVTVSTFSSAADAGDLTVTGPIVWSSNNNLTLTATRNLTINATISGSNLLLLAGGAITQASGTAITVSGNTMFGATSSAASINLAGSFTSGSISFLTGTVSKFAAVSLKGATASDQIKIGSIDFGGAPTGFTGNILVDNRAATAALSVTGSTGSATNVTLLTGGDLTLAAGASLTPSGVVTLDAEAGRFVNNAGAGVFSSGGTQVPTRFLIYASSSDLGGLSAASQSGVKFPSDPKGSGNVLYINTGVATGGPNNPAITGIGLGQTIPTTTIGTTTTNTERSTDTCVGTCSVSTGIIATVATVGDPSVSGPDPQQAAFDTAAGKDWSAQFALGLIQQNWRTTGGGYDQAAVEQYALSLCEQSGSAASCASQPGTALIAVMTDLQNGSLSEDAILAYGTLRGMTGWGGNNFGSTSALKTSPPVNAMLSALWQGATSPQNIGATATLVSGLLGQLKPGDPGYGESLGSALANLANPNDPVTQGLQTNLLLATASAIAQKQESQQALTPTEQSFANALSTQMLEQQQATLTQVSADFQAVQQNNAPQGTNLGTLFYYGTQAPDGLKHELLNFVPGSAGTSAAFNNAATTSARLLQALGQNSSSGTAIQTAATDAGAIGASMVGSLTAVASFTGVTVAGGTAATSVSAATALGIGAVDGMATTVATTAAAAAGPAAIVVAGAAILAAAAVQVADIVQFTNLLGSEQTRVNAQLAQATPPTLSSLLNHNANNLGMPLMIYCLTEMVTGTGVQTPRPITS